MRLKEWADSRNIPEERILKKLRAERASKELSILFFTTQQDINGIVQRLIEWERNDRVHLRQSTIFSLNYKQSRESNVKEPLRRNADKKDIQCYACKEFGHYKNECNKNNIEKINSIHKINGRTDCRYIYLNGKKIVAQFDSGASDNFIGEELLKQLQVKPSIAQGTNEFIVADGRKVVLNREVYLDIMYKANLYNLRFYVIDGDSKSLLLAMSF
jgi:hypothetical protein